MRVLALRRQKFGAAKSILDALPRALEEEGIELVVDDADTWIPDQTGFTNDRETSKAVKRAAQGFDLVHAWGYRAAWACSEAFYVRFPWIYTAYDMPKTRNSELIDRLNATHRAVCSGHAVKSALDEVDTLSLEIVVPGVPPPQDGESEMSREEARSRIGIRDDAFLIVAMGNFVPDRAFGSLIDSYQDILSKLPNARLYVSGSGPNPPPIHQDGIEVRGPQSSVWPPLCAADLVVVPSLRAGFSLLGAEAMWAGVPVLFRRTGGLVDMADDGINGFFFDSDESLADKVVEAYESDLTRDSVARSGQLRAQARFKFERYAREMAHIYRDVAGV